MRPSRRPRHCIRDLKLRQCEYAAGLCFVQRGGYEASPRDEGSPPTGRTGGRRRMGRASTRLHPGLPDRRRPDSGVPERGLPGARDPLAEARDRFLAAEPVDRAAVREPILASWWRSRGWNVAADHLDLSYLGAPDPETSLARAA